MKLDEKFESLATGIVDERTRRYILPKKAVLVRGSVKKLENLFEQKGNQITHIPESSIPKSSRIAACGSPFLFSRKQ